jgi:hypothetical protein
MTFPHATITITSRARELTGAQVTAVGAFERATVGWFDLWVPITLSQPLTWCLLPDLWVGGFNWWWQRFSDVGGRCDVGWA